MTKQEAYELLDAYDADPDGVGTCDNLCTVLDALPGQPEGQFTSDEIRTMVDDLLSDKNDQGFYGTPAETFYVDREGTIWLVQSPDTERFERVRELPAEAEPLSDMICNDVELPEEAVL